MPHLLLDLQHCVLHCEYDSHYALSLCCFDFEVATIVSKSEHGLCSNIAIVWHLHVSCSHAGFAF